MKSLGWTLDQYDWRPKQRRLGHRHTQEDRDWRDAVTDKKHLGPPKLEEERKTLP